MKKTVVESDLTKFSNNSNINAQEGIRGSLGRRVWIMLGVTI